MQTELSCPGIENNVKQLPINLQEWDFLFTTQHSAFPIIPQSIHSFSVDVYLNSIYSDLCFYD